MLYNFVHIRELWLCFYIITYRYLLYVGVPDIHTLIEMYSIESVAEGE